MNKLRKPEVVRALTALAWFVRSIPGAPELLQEVRALAGRVTDGLDKPGAADYVDHPWRALMAQKGLTPYSYTAYLKQSGVPQAPPPLPGQAPAWSYVPGTTDGAAAQVQAQVQARAATEHQATQGDDTIFSGLGTLTDQDAGISDGDGGAGDTAGGGDGGDDDGAEGRGQVSAPNANDDLARVDGVDDPHAGNVRTPAATDPLLAGGTVGRMVDQSQVQAGAQVQASAGNKKKLCKTVWRDDVCTDWSCDRAHPPRCGDPLCFPIRRKDCQHWHRPGGKQQRSQQQQSSQRSGQQQRQKQQRQRQQQQQGNGHGAGPGRAGQRQVQGSGSRPGPPGRRQEQQQQRQQQRHPRPQPQPQQGVGHRQRQLQQVPRPPPLPAAFPTPLLQLPGWQQQQQQLHSYRDVAARGTPHSGCGGSNGTSDRGVLRSAGFDPAQPDRALIDAVVASVVAVLSGTGRHL